MAENKTRATAADVDTFLAGAPHPDDARALAALMGEATGLPPVMWGPSIVGFGRYRYRYDSGREGESCRVGFSPRKAALTLYLGLGNGGHPDLLARLGRHTTGKGCLYLKRLGDADPAVLRALVAAAYAGNVARYPD